MKVGAIIQARTSSTRFPQKVLKELPYDSGITVLGQVIRRVRRAGRLDKVVVATTEDPQDAEIVKVAKRESVDYYRGSTRDVLERFYGAAKQYDLGVIVRITSDCPCVDPELIDLIIEKHIYTRSDYTTNILIRTFPHGLDLEALNFSVLEQAFNEAKEPHEREHVTPFIYKSNPHLFKIYGMEFSGCRNVSDIRITIDTEEDYALLCAVYDYLYRKNEFFGIEEILELFKTKPWLKLINKRVSHKKTFDSLAEEMAEAQRILDLQELSRARKVLDGRYENLHLD